MNRKFTSLTASPSRRHVASLRYLAALLGTALGAALFAVTFRWLLNRVFGIAGSGDVVSMFQHLPRWLRFLLPAAGGLLAGTLAHVTAGAGQGLGVGDVMEAVALGRVHLSMKATLLRSLGSWFAIVSGGSIGREGALIQFGATLGSTAGRLGRIDSSKVRSLMAAGTAAGFAAAYNTPLAAVLFVLEIVTGMAALDAIVSTIVATTVATAVTRALIGGGPIYGQRAFHLVSAAELIAYALLGLVAALAAQSFMSLLSRGEKLFAGLRLAQPWRAAAGGLIVGALAIRLPQITGNGYEPLNVVLDGGLSLSVVMWLLAAKTLATTASVSSGSPGGVFTPTLFFGAAVGIGVQHILVHVVGLRPLGGPGAYALVGMAAAAAAMTHAPMMAAVLVFELSGDYAVVLPLLLATAVATALSRFLRVDSLYGAELRKRKVVRKHTLEARQPLNPETPAR